MKKIILICVTGLVIFCLYWFAAAKYAAQQLPHILDDLKQEQGLTVELNNTAIGGFPARFSSQLSQIRAAQSAGPSQPAIYELSLDKATLSVPSYWPFKQNINSSGSAILTLRAAEQPLGVKMDLNDFQLAQSQFLGRTIQSESGQINFTALDEQSANSFALRSINHHNLTYLEKGNHTSFDFKAEDLKLEPTSTFMLPKAFGTKAEKFSAQGQFTVSLDQDRLEALNIKQWILEWGPAQLQGQIDLTRNQSGLQGEMAITIEDGARMLNALRDQNVISQQQYIAIRLMSGLTEDTQTLTVKVTDNQIFFGGFPLLTLPL